MLSHTLPDKNHFDIGSFMKVKNSTIVILYMILKSSGPLLIPGEESRNPESMGVDIYHLSIHIAPAESYPFRLVKANVAYSGVFMIIIVILDYQNNFCFSRSLQLLESLLIIKNALLDMRFRSVLTSTS